MTYMNSHITASLEEILTSGPAFHISSRNSSTNLVLPFALFPFVGRDAKNAFLVKLVYIYRLFKNIIRDAHNL